jgi:hypothetical protein
MPDYLTIADAVPLNQNGGFEETTPEGEVPVGWDLRNVERRLSSVADPNDDCGVDETLLSTQASFPNFYRRIVEPQPFPGYRSYIRVNVGDVSPFEARPNLANLQYFRAYQTTGANQPPYTGGQTPYAAYADDLRYTVGFSVQVLAGKARFETYVEWNDAGTIRGVNDAGEEVDVNGVPDLIASSIGPGGWRRFGYAGRFGRVVPAGGGPVAFQPSAYMVGPVLRFTKISADALVFKFSACLVVPGNYTELAYPGDLSYYLDPRNIIMITYGPVCPPGMRELELDSARFIKFTSVGSEVGTDGGSATHTHEIGDDLLNNEISKTSLPADKPSIRPSDPHVHLAGPGLSLPPSRVVTLCVRY